MAKDRSFASKVAKAHADVGKHCPKCGNVIAPHKFVTSERSKSTGAWKFAERVVGVCKCNEREVLG